VPLSQFFGHDLFRLFLSAFPPLRLPLNECFPGNAIWETDERKRPVGEKNLDLSYL
jgi:hypothetical protein